MNECPSSFTHSKEWKFRALSFLGAWVIHFWCLTLRFRVKGPVDTHGNKVDLSRTNFIIAMWHDSLIVPLWLFPRLRMAPTVLISKSGDGEFIARVCLRSGWKVVRGSSSRGGQEALEEATRLCIPGQPYRFAFTVDGPRGPRRECKFGVVALAKRLGLPILPIGIRFESAWYAKSWDRLAIPKPFSTVHVVMDRFLEVPLNASPEQLDAIRQATQQMLQDAEERGGERTARPTTATAKAA
jgi:lysophospholipid acyltransferase (LPLAT)-like uncharacterized protein